LTRASKLIETFLQNVHPSSFFQFMVDLGVVNFIHLLPLLTQKHGVHFFFLLVDWQHNVKMSLLCLFMLSKMCFLPFFAKHSVMFLFLISPSNLVVIVILGLFC